MDGFNASVPVLALGATVGGTKVHAEWEPAIKSLATKIAMFRGKYESPLAVNVVYQIPGDVIPAKFFGVRVGRYSSKDSRLLVQVGLSHAPLQDAESEVRVYLLSALEEAEKFVSRKNGAACRLDSLRDLFELL